MLGFNAFAETAFASIGQGTYVVVSGNKIVVTNNGAGVVVLAGAIVYPTGNAIVVSQNANGITFKITGSVSPTGSAIVLSTGASGVNVLTWNPIDPDVDQKWIPIDPL